MCGFFGIIGKEARGVNFNPAAIGKRLVHRGPDEHGIIRNSRLVAMFWRLSIVDQVGGKQPMVSIDNNTTILFNGEIYNYKEIRKQLKDAGHQFRTNSDTEVALVAYQRWGTECFGRFEGMFAICIVDKKSNRAFLARDRLGVKPLYYADIPGKMMVGSEQKALLASGKMEARLDRNSFQQYMLFQTILGTATLFKGIWKVPPGSVLAFDASECRFLGATRIRPLHQPGPFSTYKEFRNAVWETVLEQARLTLDTDLPICFHLSGGLDSNSLVALCRYLRPGRPFVAVSSIVEGEKDVEWPHIRQSVEFHQCRFKRKIIDADSFFSRLDDVVYYLDEPVGDPGVVAQFMVNELAAEESKIVFSGQGFDEMFFGYMRNLASFALAKHGPDALMRFVRRKENSIPKSMSKFFTGWDQFLKSMVLPCPMEPRFALYRKLCRFDPFGDGGGVSPGYLEGLKTLAVSKLDEMVERHTSLHHFMIGAETAIQLPTLLHMEDRASMRYSLETRVPFCTSAILEVAKTGKIEWAFRSNCPKGILRDIFRGILPRHILQRKQKVGRPIPLRKWLSHKDHAQILRQVKRKNGLFRDLMGADFVRHAINHKNPYDRSLWAVICISKWIDLYKVTV